MSSNTALSRVHDETKTIFDAPCRLVHRERSLKGDFVTEIPAFRDIFHIRTRCTARVRATPHDV